MTLNNQLRSFKMIWFNKEVYDVIFLNTWIFKILSKLNNTITTPHGFVNNIEYTIMLMTQRIEITLMNTLIYFWRILTYFFTYHLPITISFFTIHKSVILSLVLHNGTSFLNLILISPSEVIATIIFTSTP